MKKTIFCMLILSTLTSCIHRTEYHGHQVDDDKLNEIKVNSSDRNQVLDILGPPSIESQFGDDIYYYVSYKTDTVAMLPPKIIDTKVVSISFKKDLVSNVVKFDIDKLGHTKIEKEYTKSYGTNKNVINHFIKNFRRFNQNTKARAKKATVPRSVR